MNPEALNTILSEKWEYRTLNGEWQVYVPKGLLHIAMVQDEEVADAIVRMANTFLATDSVGNLLIWVRPFPDGHGVRG